jgi:DNA-binding response OmpR family regulator
MAAATILIVDDDKLTRWSLGRVLARVGYRTREAISVAEGLAAIQAGDLDAVLLDVVLPDGDGFTMLRTIREIRPSLPVIVMTAHASEETERMSRDLGARSHLVKPCNPAEVCAALAAAIDRPHESISH